MTTAHKSFFWPVSKWEANRALRTFLKTSLSSGRFRGDSGYFEETPNGGLRWRSQWGIARFEGDAEFIPAQKGCVLYLAMKGIDTPSRLLLVPLSRQLWRSVERFKLSTVDAAGS